MLDDINYWLVSTFVLPVLLGITLHEAAHGWVAWKLGDNTAYDKGRVSFNPFRHIDLFGTIVLPALLVFARAPFVFGWAKPVPVHFRNLHHPRRDMVLVAAAGPFANLLIAVGAGILLHFVAFIPSGGAEWIDRTLQNGIFVNLLLAVFNMLPVPPLDGGRVRGRSATQGIRSAPGQPGALRVLHLVGGNAGPAGAFRGVGAGIQLVPKYYFARYRHTI